MSRNNLIKSIQKSANRLLNEGKEYSFGDGIKLIVKDPVPKGVDLSKVISLITNNIPAQCYTGLDNIYIGQYDVLKRREISALHYDNKIFIDNNQEKEIDFLDDLVHEIAHRFEDKYGEQLYEDGKITTEFLGKRNRLYDLLQQEGEKLNYFDFLNIEYDKEFDFFLYKKIGYDKIRAVAPTLFVRPYAATSLREYFATAFESYYLKGGHTIKKISPNVYEKIRDLESFSEFKPQ